MLNIIIYEDNREFMQRNVNSINLSLGNMDIDYRIRKFDKFSDKLKDVIKNKEIKKIYVLDVEMEGVTGIEVASLIREDDWDSVIIFATAHDKYRNDIFYNRLMALDFICKYNGYEKRLVETMKSAINILCKERAFVFKYNHTVYQIPYSHIDYVEKEPLIKRCIIHTMDDDYYIADSINRILVRLGKDFFRTHQSCIVNLNNIEKLDLSNNIIEFKSGLWTDLLTEDKKKEVKKYVGIDK